MSLFEEIYGWEPLPKAVTVTVPDSPLETWHWQRASATANADATCNKILAAAFTKAILGDMPVPVVPEPEPMIPTPNALADLRKLAGRLAKTWNSKKHRAAIQGLVDKIKNLPACEAIKHDSMWESLVGHATDYCCEAIHAEAGEI